MKMNSDNIFQEAALIAFISLISGIIGGRFDPLPSELRSVLSSNQLGEGPPIFHEYHALLPNFRGDYGIKSKIVKALEKDPLYTGSDTLILPLYIPEGAIPLRIHERAPRSGKSSSSKNFRFFGGPSPAVPGESSRTSINRPIIRRIGIPSRRGHGSIRKTPTPPPSFTSFIRPWMKRRHGVSSTTSPDNVEEVKLSKILSHVADFHKQIQRSKRKEGRSKIIKKVIAKAEDVQKVHSKLPTLGTTNLTSRIRENSTLNKVNRPLNSTADANITSNIASKLATTTGGSKSFSSIRPTISPVRKLKKIISNSSLEPSDALLPEKNNTTRPINVRTSSDIKRRRIRLKPNKKGITSKINITTTTSNPKVKRLMTSDQKVDVTSGAFLSSIIPNSQGTTAIRRNTKIRLPVWPRIRQPILLKGTQTRKERKKIKSKNIIDRVLKSAVNQTSQNITSEKYKNSEKDISTIVTTLTKNHPINIKEDITPLEKSDKIVDINSNFTEQKTVNIVDHIIDIENRSLGKEGNLRLFSRVKENPILVSSTLIPIPDEITKEVDQKLKERLTSFASRKVTNYITTSTPKMSWPLTNNRKRKRKRKPHGEVVRRFYIPSKNSSDNIFSPSSPITTPKLKTAQDIVLEKLSSLMTASAESGAQSLEDIARDIEIINEELSALGIHIIDAEFDGHKLRLNQPHITPVSVKQETSSRHRNFYFEGPRNISNDKLTSDDNNFTVRRVFPSSMNATFDNTTTVRVSSSEAAFVAHQIEAPDISSDSWRPSIVTVKPIFSTENNTKYLHVTTVRNNVEASKTRSTTVSVTKKKLEKVEMSQPTTVFDINHQFSDSSHDIKAESKITDSASVFKPIIKVSGDIFPFHKTHQSPSTRGNSQKTKEVPSKEFYSFESQSLEHDFVSDEFEQNPDIAINDSQVPTIKTAVITKSKSKVEDLKSFENIKGENERSNIDNVDHKKNLNNAILVEIGNSATSKKNENISTYLYFLSLLGLVPLAAILLILYNRKKKSGKKSLPEREEKSEGHTPPINHVRSSMHAGTLDALPAYVFEKSDNRTSPWELPRSKLRITSVIGEGNFGVVWKAEARNLCDWEAGGGPTVLVAVKGVKENAGQKEKADLLRELSIMQHLGQHSNIVTLLGCCTNHEPYYLVMEYVMFGKLLTFLRESRSKNNYFNFSSDTEHLTSKDLTRFAYQISNGCEYLQTKGIIHRDLAARNILVDHNKTCKIADFGLARSIKDTDSDIYEQKSKGPLPIRWMALESLFMNIFTHKSDVWSFGILCWEIVTLGSTPYPGISAREVMRRVREGYRLERPEHCRGEFYQILTSCWNQDLNIRPSFAVIKTDLRELLDHQTGWIDLENFQESSYYSMHQNNEERL